MSVAFAHQDVVEAFRPPMANVEKLRKKEAAEAFAKAWRKEFGARVLARRKELDLTQQELATEAGISLSSLQSYEAGEGEPRASTAMLLAKALGTTPQDMLYGKD